MLQVVVLTLVRPSAESATEGRLLRVDRLVRPPPGLVQESLSAYGALQRLLVVGEMDGDVVGLERRRVFKGASAFVTLKLSIAVN